MVKYPSKYKVIESVCDKLKCITTLSVICNFDDDSQINKIVLWTLAVALGNLQGLIQIYEICNIN